MKRIMLVLLVLLLLLMACGVNRDKEISVWERLGIDPESINTMELIYDGFPVPLRDEIKNEFIQTLTASETLYTEDTHSYAPSEYLVQFTLTTGEVRSIQFYWFMGKKASDSYTRITQSGKEYPIAEVVDRRFDVKVDNKIFHFTFTGDHFWNEERSEACYDAGRQYLHLPSRDKILGYEKQISAEDFTAGLYYYEGMTWKDIIQQSDFVFLATYQGAALEDYSNKDGQYQRFFDSFLPRVWLKGMREEQTILFFRSVYPYVGDDGFVYGEADSLIFPTLPLASDKMYLICARAGEGDDYLLHYTEEPLYSVYEIDQGKCHQTINAQTFLFQDVTVADVAAFLNVQLDDSWLETMEATGDSHFRELSNDSLAEESSESWKDIISQAQTIVVGKYVGVAADHSYDSPLELGMDLFSIRKVLKGNAELLDTIQISASKGILADSNGKLVCLDFQPDEIPYEAGKEYVLFLSDIEKITRTPHYPYAQTGCLSYYDSALIKGKVFLLEEEVLFPSSQRGDHPLTQITLAKLQELINSTGVN